MQDRSQEELIEMFYSGTSEKKPGFKVRIINDYCLYKENQKIKVMPYNEYKRLKLNKRSGRK